MPICPHVLVYQDPPASTLHRRLYRTVAPVSYAHMAALRRTQIQKVGGGGGGGWRRRRGCKQQTRWTLEITLLGLVQGGGVPAV